MRHNSRDFFFLVAQFGQVVQIITWPANILDKTKQNKTKSRTKQNKTKKQN